MKTIITNIYSLCPYLTVAMKSLTRFIENIRPRLAQLSFTNSFLGEAKVVLVTL